MSKTPKEVTCPRCGKKGHIIERKREAGTYLYVYHGVEKTKRGYRRKECYLGKKDHLTLKFGCEAAKNFLTWLEGFIPRDEAEKAEFVVLLEAMIGQLEEVIKTLKRRLSQQF